MQSSVGIRERIDHVYPSLRPAERAVAQYVRDHLDEAAALTVGQLADAARVSQPTVIRFSRKLGFGGYRELRYVLKHPEAERRVTFDPLEGFDLNPWDDVDSVPVKAVNSAKTLLDDMASSLDQAAFRKAVSLIAGASLIDIYGVENSLVPATDLFTKLGYLGLKSRLNTDAYLQQIGAGHLGADDTAVAFSYSGSSADTVKALRLAKAQGAHTIAVTNAYGTPLANWADVCLYAGRGEHTIYGNAIFSRVAHTALVDMLYMGVILSDYGRFSTELDRSGKIIADREYRG
ncbi:Fe-S cluster assembly protein HesB [Bifidobacterium ramosum]|uniref:Fe-S cluster assembly protein HesB n=1 Tax=Bifidobacterium ramosum TaxID=1798158 RepID=A0A6L4X1T9_9BIFI|nr:MurR/RpiR family transcriptional regulator [Bifidobacterium ramosum]KAB8288971.1 Fe-S cluster assembly protein HesB [Bifidobacterium ramosum]NEG70687.1 SIS domain-containing protein [Bifidobacterium ramosum]